VVGWLQFLVWVLMVLTGCGRSHFTPLDDAAIGCPAGYTSLAMGCYRFGGDNVTLTWLDAEHDCERDGAHLAVIDDVAEATTVTALASPTFDNWIGASDRVVEGTFVDVHGQPMLALAWLPGQPSGDDCVEIDDMLTIDDSDCLIVNEYVCEYDGEPADVTAF